MTDIYERYELHDVRGAAVLEQITRWAVVDNWSDALSGEAQKVVQAAQTGGLEYFVGTLATLAEHEGHGSRASMLHATLHGNVDLIGHALADNEGLRSLYRTTAERAQGIDMAEITTPNGLRLRAEQTGEAYQTAVVVEDAPGRSDVLANNTITAATATDALRTAAQREHAVHGLDRTDLQLVDQQLARLDYLTTIEAALPGAPPAAQSVDTIMQVTGRDLHSHVAVSNTVQTREGRRLTEDSMPTAPSSETYSTRMEAELGQRLGVQFSGRPDASPQAPDADSATPSDRWSAVVTAATGRDLRGEPGWTGLAATLDRAAAAGWDAAGQLPATVAQAPLPTHGSVSHDLAYRVMDACPDAVPAAPSVAQINGTGAASTGRQREAAERAIRPTPAPDRGPTVGR
jgi:hypothetical protein